MSKRGPMFQQGGKMDEDNYQEDSRDRAEEPVTRATAAQLAQRKIKQLKPRASRQNGGLGGSVPMPSANPFASLSTPNPPSTPSQSFPQFGNSMNNNQPAPFAFGASAQQADPPQFGSGFSGSSSFTFGQQPQQPSQVPGSNTNLFGNSSSTANPFASNTPSALGMGQADTPQQSAGGMFGNTLNNNSTSGFNFGGSSSAPFAGFGNTPQQPAAQEQTQSLFNLPGTPSASNGMVAETEAPSGNFIAPTAPSMLGAAPASPFPQTTSGINWADPLGTAATSTPGPGFSFGATASQAPTPAPPAGGLFGASTSQAPTTGLFGTSTHSSGTPLVPSTPARDSNSSPFQFGKSLSQNPPVASTPLSLPSSTAQESSASAPSLFSFGTSTTQVQRTSQPSPAPATEPATASKPLFSWGTPAKETPAASASSTPTAFKFGDNTAQSSSTPVAKTPFSFPTTTSQPAQAPTPAFTSTPAPAPSLFQQSTPAPTNPPATKSLFERAAPEASQSPAPTPIFAASPQPSSDSAPATQPPEMPKVPKVFVSDEWKSASAANAAYPPELDDIAKEAAELATKLATLNEQFRAKINRLPALADWCALSSWHFKESTTLTQRLTALRKQRAASKGVTGYESSLSTKRSAFEPPETPTKRARADDGPTTPFTARTPQDSTTPTAEPQAKAPEAAPSQASSLFGSLLNKSTTSADQDATPKPASPLSAQAIGASFGSSTPQAPATEPSKASSQNTGFSFGSELGKTPGAETPNSAAPSTPFSSGLAAPKAPATELSKPTSSGFQFGKSDTPATSNDAPKDLSKSTSQLPNFGAGSSSSVPAFGASSASTGSNAFLSQFAKKSMTAEEFAAERKKKAHDEDYESDEMTEEEWSAQYDRQEAQRKAQEEAAKASTPTFTVSAASSVSNGEVSTKTPFNFQKSLSGASTPAAVNSRGASPALSVFDEPPAAKPSGSNIFGHLSSENSSNNQDNSDDSAEEDAEEEEQPTGRSPSFKRKLNDDDSESEEETLEETMRRKKQETTPPKGGSLFSRMTRDPVSDTESANINEGVFSKSLSGATTNGTSTPMFRKFDFAAAAAAGSQSVPPKPSIFAGDQTYKEGTPLKFSTTTPSTDSKDAPSLKVQPASPSGPFSFLGAASTSNPFAPKPASTGTDTFSFLNKGASGATTPSFLTPNPGQSGVTSGVSSVFSSRAATPLSEQETSAQESGNEENEEPAKQIHLEALTDQEKADNDILFEYRVTLVKKQFNRDDKRGWETVAKGPVYMLRDKSTNRAFVRVKLQNGTSPVQFAVLKGVSPQISGSKRQMVTVPYHNAGRLSNYIFAFGEEAVASAFSQAFMDARPAPA